jgi:hypothetical protein
MPGEGEVMADYYRIGSEWHIIGELCNADKPGNPFPDEQTTDIHRVHMALKYDHHDLCEYCRAEICWGYMMADDEGERQTLVLEGMEAA